MNELSLNFVVPANIDPESQLMILIERAIINQITVFYGLEDRANALEGVKRVLDLHQSRLKTGFYS